jgi:hypothetical protein
MPSPSPLPSTGEVLLDARGGQRNLRVSWHHELDVVVLSLWRAGVCVGTFRLGTDEVPGLIEILQAGFDGGLGSAGDGGRRAAG